MATTWTFPTELVLWVTHMAEVLHGGNAERLYPLLAGMLFAQGRLTVASWLRGGELGKDYQGYYYFLGSLGRKIKLVAEVVLSQALQVLGPGDRLLFAIDDTPTKRYGPKVEGAGIHHNPTPGPADQKYVYGHVWVVLSLVVRHSLWGTIGLPLLAFLYVRKANLKSIGSWKTVKFQTKLEQAAEMVEWLAGKVKYLMKVLWVVTDGAYAKKPFLSRAKKAGAIVVSRLRKDAGLWSVPVPTKSGRRGRGRPRKYGKEKFSLPKRAGHKRGWQSGTFTLYNKAQEVTYKTFLAMFKPAAGMIRVVLVREDSGEWRAYFCTNPDATVAEILEAVADRAVIEQDFHDVKEVHGAGQQQLRNYWANIASFNLILWMHTLIELWAWARSHKELVDRSASPWDDASRRPSHANRRNALRREVLENEFRRRAGKVSLPAKFKKLFSRLVKLAA